jgi:hypothetical protein
MSALSARSRRSIRNNTPTGSFWFAPMPNRRNGSTPVSPDAAWNTPLRSSAARASGGSLGSALGKCRGEFVAMVNADAILEPDALGGWMAAVGPGTAAVYSDWDSVDSSGRRHTPRFTPEFSPELLSQTLYWGRCFFARTAQLRETNWQGGAPILPLEHELALRLGERSASIGRVARMLWHMQEEAAAETADSATPLPAPSPHHPAHAKSVNGSPARPGPTGVDDRASIIICSRNSEQLRKCLNSLLPTLGGRHEVIVVAHQAGDGPALEQVASSHAVRMIPYDGAFHFGVMNGLGASASHAQALCFLNDDVYPVTREPGLMWGSSARCYCILMGRFSTPEWPWADGIFRLTWVVSGWSRSIGPGFG